MRRRAHPSRRAIVALGVGTSLAGLPAAAHACAVCAAGDPTLTVMNAEQPFRGRARGALELRAGSSRIGDAPADATTVHEQRLDLGFVYMPKRDLALSIEVPGLVRAVERGGASVTYASLGDIELRAKDLVLLRREGAYHHQVALFGGMKFPSAPLQRDPTGAYLPADLQPGCSSVVPLVGGFYGVGRGAWSFAASGSLLVPISVRSGPHAGDSFRTSATLQAQPTRVFATRLGFSTRLDQGGEYAGASDPNSGGFVGYVSTEILVSPVTDLVLNLGVYFPAVQALVGEHREGSILSAGLLYDF